MSVEDFPPDCAISLGWEDTIGCTACVAVRCACTTEECAAYGLPVDTKCCQNSDGILRSNCGRCGRPNSIERL